MTMRNGILGILLLIYVGSIQTVCGQCTFGSPFEGTTWHDSTRGDVTFSTSTMSKWSHSGASVLVFPTWTCVNFTESSYMVLRTTTTVLLTSGSTAYAYVCMKLSAITAYSFSYYLQNIQQPELAYERVRISTLSTLTQTDVCNEAITVPEVEYHVLVQSGVARLGRGRIGRVYRGRIGRDRRSRPMRPLYTERDLIWSHNDYCGFEANAAITCPESLLFSADYVYYGSDGTTACDTTTDNWNVCLNTSRMTFDLTTCSQQIAFSSGGVLWCVANVFSTYDYTLVYNNDTTVDGSTTERFTCIASESTQTYASFTARNCSIRQTPSTFDKEPQNLNDIGHRLVIGTKSQTCGSVSVDDGGLTAGEIAAIVLSVLYVIYLWGLVVTVVIIVLVIMAFQFFVVLLELTGQLPTAKKAPTLSYIDLPEPDKEWSPRNNHDVVTPTDVDLKKGDKLTKNGTLPPIKELYLESRANGTVTDRPKVFNATGTKEFKGKNDLPRLVNESETNNLRGKDGTPAIHKMAPKQKKMLTAR